MFTDTAREDMEREAGDIGAPLNWGWRGLPGVRGGGGGLAGGLAHSGPPKCGQKLLGASTRSMLGGGACLSGVGATVTAVSLETAWVRGGGRTGAVSAGAVGRMPSACECTEAGGLGGWGGGVSAPPPPYQ